MAKYKTKIVLITKRPKQTSIKIRIGEYSANTPNMPHSQPALKYLGVMPDQKLNFKSNLERLAKCRWPKTNLESCPLNLVLCSLIWALVLKQTRSK